MFTTNIALGAGVGNLEAAAEFYETEVGLKRGETNGEWIEANGAEKEPFIKTPFGQFICVPPQAS